MRQNRAMTSTPDHGFQVRRVDPGSPQVQALVRAHLDFAHRHSPPEDVHALAADALAAAELSVFGATAAGGTALLGIGALRALDERHAELKSMHVAEAARGRGVGRAILAHLLAVARARGVGRVSLETGSMAAFEPARGLYVSAGFRPCEPFGAYAPSPSSTFLRLDLPPDEARGGTQIDGTRP